VTRQRLLWFTAGAILGQLTARTPGFVVRAGAWCLILIAAGTVITSLLWQHRVDARRQKMRDRYPMALPPHRRHAGLP
jgi:hypothetical protein